MLSVAGLYARFQSSAVLVIARECQIPLTCLWLAVGGDVRVRASRAAHRDCPVSSRFTYIHGTAWYWSPFYRGETFIIGGYWLCLSIRSRKLYCDLLSHPELRIVSENCSLCATACRRRLCFWSGTSFVKLGGILRQFNSSFLNFVSSPTLKTNKRILRTIGWYLH